MVSGDLWCVFAQSQSYIIFFYYVHSDFIVKINHTAEEKLFF